jgi:hypothetical protein
LVEFSYPLTTPQGHAVEQLEEHVEDHRGDMERVHLSSPESGELYFEIARFRELTPRDDYLSHGKYLAQRFGPDSVSPLVETTVEGGRPGPTPSTGPTTNGRCSCSTSQVTPTASSTTLARS